MKLSKICCLLLFVCLTFGELSKKGKESENPEQPQKRVIGALTTAIIGASISAGASLAGTTVNALKDPTYGVTVSGSVENYAKWAMHFKTCEIKSGYMNIPMRSVAPGQKEGFAGHKTGHTATGSWIRCTFQVDNALVHFMYSAPYNFNHYSNTLAVAVCPKGSRDCKNMNAYKMYYNSRNFLARRKYYYSVKTVKICKYGFCFTGSMGTSHKPTIHLKLMPTSYDNLSDASKTSSVKERWNKADYERLVGNL